jgi:N-formylglutamate amidohydrolase
VLNGRFRGGYITRHYGDPAYGVHALQLELAQRIYMDETPPYRFLESRADELRPLLRNLLNALLDWRPHR